MATIDTVQRHEGLAGSDAAEFDQQLDDFHGLARAGLCRAQISALEGFDHFEIDGGRVVVGATHRADRTGGEPSDERFIDTEGDVKAAVVEVQAALVFEEIAVVELDAGEIGNARCGVS